MFRCQGYERSTYHESFVHNDFPIHSFLLRHHNLLKHNQQLIFDIIHHIMKSLLSFLLALPFATASLIPAVLDIAVPNLLNAQDHLDPCHGEAATTTLTYDAAYKQHADGSCPAKHWKVDNVGCCPNGSAAKTILEGVGCCPCGATCAGYLPDVKDWHKRKMGEFFMWHKGISRACTDY
jgi:hypothetical protein